MVDTKETMADLGIEPIEPPSATKSKSTSSSSSKKGRPTDLSIIQLEKMLVNQIEIIGLLVTGFDSYDGSVITNNADDLAEKLIDLAKAHKPFRDFLEKLVATGTYSALIALIGGEILLPISVHHGWLPEPINSTLAEARDIPVKQRKVKDNEDSESVRFGLVPDGGWDQATDDQRESSEPTE